jgi:hypothetical protein
MNFHPFGMSSPKPGKTMSTLTKSRRMPTQYRIRPGGVTEIRYSATPEIIVVLPGTRWLEQRRERESRLAALAAEVAEVAEETQFAPEDEAPVAPPVIDTELAALDFAALADTAPDPASPAEEMAEVESLSWTDRMRVATTKLMRRQAPWFTAL